MRATRVVRLLAVMLVMALGMTGPALAQQAPEVRGSTIQNVTAQLEDGSEFTGRVVNLQLTDIVEGDDGTLQALASGRLIGQLNGQRINQTFENVQLGILNQDGDPLLPNDLDNQDVCPILFLELGPIFLDLLGLIVEVPDPIIVEIRAERGPGQLLGNLLCALLGILDPNDGLL